ncbi:MAG: hypothetical protein ACK4EY_00865 [Flavipsychrobacter sp.]
MKNYAYLLSISCVLLLSSCYQRMYFPDRVNSPGFKEAGEVKASFAVKPQSSPDKPGVNSSNLSPSADVAFSPVKHLGIIGSYRSVLNRYINEDPLGTISQYPYYELYDTDIMGGLYNDNRWEVGVGFYNTMGKRGIFEIYGGYGQGKVKRQGYDYPQFNFNSRYQRFFIQPAIGFNYENVALTGGVRFAINRYTTFNAADTSLRYVITGDHDTRTDVLDQNFGLLEPFVNFEVGYKYVKFNLQVGASTPFLSNTVSGTFPVYATFGFTFHFAPRYLKGF